jgi:hypothetical protein
MGCLNDDDRWEHWFGNVHLSGPCNRRCYFCIGQHMMALDALNTLHTPAREMKGFMSFIEACKAKGIRSVNLTGTNTDPLLYDSIPNMVMELRLLLPGVSVGIRTNGSSHHSDIRYFDHGSITVCSADYHTNLEIMGGPPPDLGALAEWNDLSQFKLNCVLGPLSANMENVAGLVDLASAWGITRINLREPYGQEHVGSEWIGSIPDGTVLQESVPFWDFGEVRVFYWDVHYVAVRSVNLYANGRISMEYPITKGHIEGGVVIPQSEFQGHHRRQKQWM